MKHSRRGEPVSTCLASTLSGLIRPQTHTRGSSKTPNPGLMDAIPLGLSRQFSAAKESYLGLSAWGLGASACGAALVAALGAPLVAGALRRALFVPLKSIGLFVVGVASFE